MRYVDQGFGPIFVVPDVGDVLTLHDNRGVEWFRKVLIFPDRPQDFGVSDVDAEIEFMRITSHDGRVLQQRLDCRVHVRPGNTVSIEFDPLRFEAIGGMSRTALKTLLDTFLRLDPMEREEW